MQFTSRVRVEVQEQMLEIREPEHMLEVNNEGTNDKVSIKEGEHQNSLALRKKTLSLVQALALIYVASSSNSITHLKLFELHVFTKTTLAN